MRVGIIAEGKSDFAVMVNILKGKLELDRAFITPILPEFQLDETDRAQMREEEFSNWTLVKQCCIDKARISDFLEPFEDKRIVVIQIDTAEMHLVGFNVEKPQKDAENYSRELRERVIHQINVWLEGNFNGLIYHAISIEETEAWLLTIYDSRALETATYNTPKERLFRELNKKLSEKEKKILRMPPLDQYHELSKDFRKKKLLMKYCKNNESLALFCESLDDVATPEE
jgi:hypothetical protein